MISAETAFFQEQALGLRRLAREVSNGRAHSALRELAQEYDVLSVDPKPWPPRADAPRLEIIAGEHGAIRPFVERRRPGRVNYVNPALIELLRAPTNDAAENNLGAGPILATENDLSPAKGTLLLAMALAVSIWTGGIWLFSLVSG